LAQYVLFEELNDTNQPATAVEIVKRLRKELENAIATEKTARETGDTNTLNSAKSYTDGKITQEVTDRNAAIKVETDARTAAITKEVSDRNSAISTAISNAVGANGAIMTELQNTNSTLYKEIVKIAKAQMTT
jgi:hypothetical protein